ncbi:MAG TPA: hypothetical protein VF411_11590 [Bacteroidia bacterium]
MKKVFSKVSALAITTMVLATSCTKTGATGPAGAAGGTGSTGPALTGTVVGYVDLFDQYGELLPASAAGEVYLTSPNLAANWKDSTYVSSGGANTYSTTLTTGTYQFNVSTKTGGFGNLLINSMNFVGGGTQYNTAHIQLAQVPTFSVTGLSVGTSTSTFNPAVTTTVTIAGGDIAKSRKAIIFFGSANTVSSNPGTYLGFTTVTINPNSYTVSANISCTSVLFPAGADSSATIYLNAYPISYNTAASAYPDVNTGKTIFNSIGVSTVTTPSVVVP